MSNDDQYRKFETVKKTQAINEKDDISSQNVSENEKEQIQLNEIEVMNV
jgi:hypothetical protein